MATDEILPPSATFLDLPFQLCSAILSQLSASDIVSLTKLVSKHVVAALHDAQASATELLLKATPPPPQPPVQKIVGGRIFILKH
jgi:hypothetical protein